MEWMDVTGWEGFYEVSDTGLVRRLLAKKILAQKVDRYGYSTVHLRKPGSESWPTVHRLVALAFIPNPENKPQVNHKWGIKGDNRVSELEWVTTSEQILHSFRVLGRKPAGGIMHGKDNPATRKIIQFDLSGNFIKEWECLKQAAEELKLFGTNISKAANGKYRHTGGFLWKYAS